MSHEAWMQDSVPQAKAIQKRIIQTTPKEHFTEELGWGRVRSRNCGLEI